MAGDALTKSFFSEKHEGHMLFLAEALLSLACSIAVIPEKKVVGRDGGKPPSRGMPSHQLVSLHNRSSSSPLLCTEKEFSR